MNPSANAWIPKLLSSLNQVDNPNYQKLRECGFVYGTNISTCFKNQSISSLTLSKEELAKINLVSALYAITQTTTRIDSSNFTDFIVEFYSELEKPKTKPLSWFKLNQSPESKLESIIAKRVQTNSSVLERNFSNILTNVFLNIDVETFHHFTVYKSDCVEFSRKFESALTNIVSIALHFKSKKTSTEHILTKLLESSLRYQSKAIVFSPNVEELKLDFLKTLTSKLYILDIACMAIFSDEKVEASELDFIYSLSLRLNLTTKQADEAITSIKLFIKNHRDEISYFNTSNPIKHFYDRTYRSTTTLLIRNKKRLINEIYESKELLILLSKSTHTELNSEEKRLVKQQLIDIFKSIPSLAIFALPGGGVLLPIIIKFIPKLLPSSFNENLND
ncbi:LETM1-related biofilm-associated protein [Psychroflexus sp. ALD_RP9]|uniref:LETM1-related biofilm-associated protein n=1 Tax=Psychroflexus sp. ALD_RP9 TaxID=2777186 RepID=UPI001A905269|nr:LETM1-related biofilm-associated protein [Psychroflexus sp. ALD_RP9]QSS97399.1 hypothetical protein IMZ30_01405 [Psychroflexus sp. ALD_RP9]